MRAAPSAHSSSPDEPIARSLMNAQQRPKPCALDEERRRRQERAVRHYRGCQNGSKQNHQVARADQGAVRTRRRRPATKAKAVQPMATVAIA